MNERFIKDGAYAGGGDKTKKLIEKKVGKAWFVCPHCGTYFEANSGLDKAQCMHCGSWAVRASSHKGKTYEGILSVASKMMPYNEAALVAEQVLMEVE